MSNSIQFFPLRNAKLPEEQDKGQKKDDKKDGNVSEPGGGRNGDDSRSGK